MSQEQTLNQLNLFAEGSHANLFPQPGNEAARMMTVTSGRKCCELSRHIGPLGCLVKMLLESSTWNSTMCFLTWKEKVTKHKRLLFQLARSMPSTNGKESGFWPTPISTEADHGGPNQSSHGKPYGLAATIHSRMFPTPRAESGVSRKPGTGGKCLQEEARKSVGANTGMLNPMWVEWLMGWPLGWTDLKQLETGKFQQWCERHGTSCAKEPPQNTMEQAETAYNSRVTQGAKAHIAEAATS